MTDSLTVTVVAWTLAALTLLGLAAWTVRVAMPWLRYTPPCDPTPDDGQVWVHTVTGHRVRLVSRRLASVPVPRIVDWEARTVPEGTDVRVPHDRLLAEYTPEENRS